MGKYAVLLLLAGLALGLWLGFNPTTHRDLVRWWDRTTASQARGRETPTASISLRQLDSSVTRWFRTETRPQSSAPEKSSPTATTTWKQVVATLQAFWHALEQIWARFLLNLGIKRI